ISGTLPGAWLTAGHAPANDDARPAPGRLGNGRLVLWLEGRVRDLQNIKHTHGYVVGEVRQDRGTAQKAHLAGALQGVERLNGPRVLQKLPGRAEVKLDDIQIVGLHAPQALVHGVHDVLAAIVVQARQRDTKPRALARGKLRHIQGAPALGGQEELLTA